jgi:phage terminase large subunit
VNLKIQLQRKQMQFLELLQTTPIVGMGGAKGGGKSFSLRAIWLLFTLRDAGSINAIFRRTFPELEDNHIGPLFTEYPELRPYYNSQRKEIRFPENESVLRFRYCERESDVDTHQGREYNRLGIDQVEQWTEAMFWRLMGCNRSSKETVPARAGLTFNPGGIGHGWVKRLFIDKKLKDRELAAGFRPSDFAFVQSLVTDNQALMKYDPGYLKRLEAEPNEQLRKALRYGIWDINAGQFFTELDRGVHLIDDFAIPEHWNRFGSYDYGYNHPAFWLWWAADEDGNVYLYREHARNHMGIDEQAELVKAQHDSKGLIFYAGHDCWAKKKGKDPTIAEEFASLGVYLKQANIDRRHGASRCRQYFRWKEITKSDGTKKMVGPRVKIFRSCELTWDSLTRMVYDPNDIEDVLKIDAAEGDPWTGDDGYDAFRHGIMTRPGVSIRPRDPWVDKYEVNNARVEGKDKRRPWI